MKTVKRNADNNPTAEEREIYTFDIPDARRCRGTTRAGNRCRHAAIAGGNVCGWHGGSAPHVIAAAKLRMVAALDGVFVKLEELIERDDLKPETQLALIKLVLDRAGFGPTSTLKTQDEHSVNYDAMSRDELRAAALGLAKQISDGDTIDVTPKKATAKKS